MTSPSCVRSNWGSWSDDRDDRGGVIGWPLLSHQTGYQNWTLPNAQTTLKGSDHCSENVGLDGLQSFMEQSSVKIKLFVLKRIGDERLALGHLDHIEAARNLGVCTSFVALGTPLETFTTVLTSIYSVSQCSPYNFEKLRRPMKRFDYSSFLSTGHIRSKSSVFILQHCNTDHASKVL